MDGLLSAISTGLATATATTFDDNIYLAMFFSRTNQRFRPLHIVVGEFVGFSVLVAISLSGFLLGRLTGSAWLGLLGLLPISIGVNTLLGRETRQQPQANDPMRVRSVLRVIPGWPAPVRASQGGARCWGPCAIGAPIRCRP